MNPFASSGPLLLLPGSAVKANIDKILSLPLSRRWWAIADIRQGVGGIGHARCDAAGGQRNAARSGEREMPGNAWWWCQGAPASGGSELSVLRPRDMRQGLRRRAADYKRRGCFVGVNENDLDCDGAPLRILVECDRSTSISSRFFFRL